MHWASVKRRLEPWREEVWVAWQQIKREHKAEVRVLRNHMASIGPVQVLVTLPFDRTEKQWAADRRDPHNYVPTVKAIIDVLTDRKVSGKKTVEKRLFEDDNYRFVTVIDPKLIRGTIATVEVGISVVADS